MMHRLPRVVLAESFAYFRQCGAGQRECQVLWLSSWESPESISEVVHPLHRSHSGGFELDVAWLNSFWTALADRNFGVRAQIHTHPGAAFHSPTDDAWPILHTPGFLSLVIPNFGMGKVDFDDAFLAELGGDGRFREVPISRHLAIV